MEELLAKLGEMLKGINVNDIMTLISELAKKVMEVLKPLLGSLTGGETTPETPATNA